MKTELLRHNEGEFHNEIIRSKLNFDSQIEALKLEIVESKFIFVFKIGYFK